MSVVGGRSRRIAASAAVVGLGLMVIGGCAATTGAERAADGAEPAKSANGVDDGRAAAAAADADPDAAEGPEDGGVEEHGVGWASDSAALPPAGHGSLRQEEMTVSLRSGDLLIKVTPLDEAVIRLAAPDTYARLHALAESRGARVARIVGRESVVPFLVSFFSYAPDRSFEPDDLQLEHQSRLLRPLAIVPITPGWGRRRLRQQETQSAVYGFDAGIDLSLPLTIRYGFERSDVWERIIPRLETEYRRAMSRAAG
ncbi:MAG: hypothetical protein ACODAE_10425 [Gemmatimonadota bacterium]